MKAQREMLWLYLREQIKAERVITFSKKGLLPPVTQLRDVMRDAGEDEAGKAGHDGRRPKRRFARGNNMGFVIVSRKF
jgi:hypothetical protein